RGPAEFELSAGVGMLVPLVVLAPAVGDPVADAPTTQAATWLSPGLLTRPPSGADALQDRSRRPLKLRRRADDSAHMTNETSPPSLGRLLVERGVISEEQLETALRVQRDQGGMLGEILTSRGWVTPLSIAAALAKQKAARTGADDEESDRPERGENWKP